jgi:hypothetical protein
MTFKPTIWYPIAVVLSVANIAGAWFAAGPGEGAHVGTHAVLAVAFGLWAQRLRQVPLGGGLEAQLEELEVEVLALEQELNETQERLDFAERMLVQERDARRIDPLR